MPYLYETHLHTCLASLCGVSTGKEQARYYKEQGYTGIIVTEHFYGGNTRIDRKLPWEQFVDGYWRGYEDAREEGEKIGLDVFFGIEQNYNYDEYLIYGLTKEYMKSRPDMPFWTRKEQFEEVHKAGGCIIQAHPFRMRPYMDKIRLDPLFADGVEAANACNDPLDDARCMRYAKENRLVMTAGSDNHQSPFDRTLFGVELDERLRTIDDYVKLIRNHGNIRLHVPKDRFLMPQFEPDEEHIAYVLDENENISVSSKQWMD